MEIKVVKNVMKANSQVASQVREELGRHGVVALNLMSAPGSGKTSLIEWTARNLKDKVRLGVIVGDPDTARDAERIAPLGVPVVQVNTGGGCHLDAPMIHQALGHFDLKDLDLLFLENVGNMVCPVNFDLGESKRVAVISTPEGHDKPIKYPELIRSTDLIVLNKDDLMPYVDFDEHIFLDDLKRIKPDFRLLRVSCRTGQNMDAWAEWLMGLVRKR